MYIVPAPDAASVHQGLSELGWMQGTSLGLSYHQRRAVKSRCTLPPVICERPKSLFGSDQSSTYCRISH